ncbi:PREDICTED: interferon-induced protein 44-like [Branchiostoma belcheri]|uniref:Interferon-induced protein 44-like n=1 Tax=Branchiostoma belcheri TaxID=7741 RepID=A0A6P4Z4L4_BRABE|nr:PREDICTED: interferon-induced protein 44-like [Branchiostoma belcheri]
MKDFDGVRIGLFGITGSGKSSFINSVFMALHGEDEGPAVIQSTGAEGTIILEALPVTDGFTLLDTRGFGLLGGDAEKEILAILNGDIKDESGIDRDKTVKTSLTGVGTVLRDETHVVLWFVKANDPRLHKGAYRCHMDFLRQQLLRRGIAPITVITHHDKIAESQEEEVLAKASAATGSPRSFTFFVTNYHVDQEGDYRTHIEAMKVMRSALLVAERYVKIHKQQEQYKRESEAIGNQKVTGPNETVEDFFRRLSSKEHIPFDQIQPIIDKLKKEDITTSKSLSDNWVDIRGDKLMSDWLRGCIEKELADTFKEINL